METNLSFFTSWQWAHWHVINAWWLPWGQCILRKWPRNIQWLPHWCSLCDKDKWSLSRHLQRIKPWSPGRYGKIGSYLHETRTICVPINFHSSFFQSRASLCSSLRTKTSAYKSFLGFMKGESSFFLWVSQTQIIAPWVQLALTLSNHFYTFHLPKSGWNVSSTDVSYKLCPFNLTFF
jgi:hypothetical protein